MKERLDVLLVQRQLASSREKAKAIIMAGNVFVKGMREDKAGTMFDPNVEIEVKGQTLRYVSRGGLKLEKAMTHFDLTLEGKVCMDVGASTGGFTDCMLQNGAEFVYAVDVGHGQLDESLVNDKRVKNMEGVNIKDVSPSDFDRKIQFISTDVSFISLKKVIPKISELLCEEGKAVMLVKPQFECGRADIGKNGIVRSEKVHKVVLGDIISFCGQFGLSVTGADYSPIQGGDGNIEYLIYAQKSGITGTPIDCSKIISEAHKSFKKGK